MTDYSKYPVKYIALGIKEIHELKGADGTEDCYGDVYAYAVVRAWVINEIKTYAPKGGYTTSYDVVPEWTQELEENYPKFNLYGRCYNTVNVDSSLVFHSADQAKKYCSRANKTLLEQKLENHSDEIASELKKEYKEKLQGLEKKEIEHLKDKVVAKR